MEGMSAPRGTASPTFDDCVQWYVEATRTSDKEWVADWAVAAWGQAYALAVAKEALQQTVAASGAGADAGAGAGAPQASKHASNRGPHRRRYFTSLLSIEGLPDTESTV